MKPWNCPHCGVRIGYSGSHWCSKAKMDVEPEDELDAKYDRIIHILEEIYKIVSQTKHTIPGDEVGCNQCRAVPCICGEEDAPLEEEQPDWNWGVNEWGEPVHPEDIDKNDDFF